MIATGHAERTAITRRPPIKRVLQNRSLCRRYEVDEIDANIITDIYKSTIEGETDQETIKRHSEKDAENRFEDLFAERWIRHVLIGNTSCGQSHTSMSRRDTHDTIKIHKQNRPTSSLPIHCSTKISQGEQRTRVRQNCPVQTQRDAHTHARFLKVLTVAGFRS